MKKILLLLLIILFVNPAVQGATKKSMEIIMDSWVGENINTVIESWGYPTDEKYLGGKHLLYWSRSSTMYIPQYTSGTTNTQGSIYGNTYRGTSYISATTYGGYSVNFRCTRILEVNQFDVVTSWQWQGNNCPFTLSFGYKLYGNPYSKNEYTMKKSNEKSFNDAEYRKTVKLRKKYKKSLIKKFGANFNDAEYRKTVELTRKYKESLKSKQSL